MKRRKFYLNTVNELIKDKKSSILICGGGELDKSIFNKLGFINVTISNLDTRMKKDLYLPFQWKFENAENLSLKDNSFDFVIIHAAIHHASSPHKVVTEMYRVASKGILAFENRDSFTMKLLEKFNLTQTFEHAAVYFNNCIYGGMNNTEIPNYIYRWTEREIEKTIKSYAPYFEHNFKYKYGTAFPCSPELENRGKLKWIILKIAQPFFFFFAKIFPRQQNLFAFYIEKPNITNGRIFPWLKYDKKENKIKFNKEWASKKYKTYKN